jgi:hypothetical protein
MSNLADLAKKQETQPKYDSILSKLFMMTPCRALCVHLMRQYTLKVKDKTRIKYHVPHHD